MSDTAAPESSLRARLEALREDGWTVAVHNDYRQNGKAKTFWLMVKGETALKGEGDTDDEALGQIARRVALLAPELERGADGDTNTASR